MSSWSCSVASGAVLLGLLAGLSGCGGETTTEPAASMQVAGAEVAAPTAGGDEVAAPASGDAETGAPEPPAGGDVVLEADLYSGRVNPSWSLSEEESYGLRALLDRLPAGACPRPARDGLGFRGFGVAGLDLGRVRVEGDCVRVQAAGGADERLDPQRLAHRYLADLAAHHDPALRPLLKAS